jgi:hypothetical protein
VSNGVLAHISVLQIGYILIPIVREQPNRIRAWKKGSIRGLGQFGLEGESLIPEFICFGSAAIDKED